MAILFGIGAAVGWGVADFLARFATRRVGTFRTLLFMQVAGIAGLLVWLGARGVGAGASGLAGFLGFPHQGAFWAWVVVSGVLNTLASLAFYRALETGLLTIVSPVCSAYPAVTVLVSVYMGERLSVGHVAGIVCATVGVVLAATSFGAGGASAGGKSGGEGTAGGGGELAALDAGGRGARGHLTRGVGLAVAASLMYGVNFVVIGYGITPYLDRFRSVLLLRSVSVAVLLLISVPASQSIAMAYGSAWGLIAAVGIFDTAAFICGNLGLGTGHVSIVTVLGSLFGAVTVFLGWIFLREHVGKTQWLGVFLIFVGIILVSI